MTEVKGLLPTFFPSDAQIDEAARRAAVRDARRSGRGRDDEADRHLLERLRERIEA